MSKRTRVALFTQDMSGGGAERSTMQIASGLASRGYDVDLVLCRATGEYLSQIPSSIRVIDLKTRQAILSYRPLIRYLEKERPHAILSTLNQPNVVAAFAGQKTGIRSVISIRNNLSAESSNGKLRTKFIPAFMSKASRVANEICAVSHGVAEDSANLLSLPISRIHVIYNPVIDDEFQLARARVCPHPWLQDQEIPVVMSAGRLSSQKDFQTLIAAFARIRARARLIILGEGPMRGALEKQIDELQIRDRVALPGFDENPMRYMSKAHVFALSSKYEGLPGVLIQALGCGCNLVSTDCPSGPREVLQDGRYGALVPVGDINSMASGLEAALTSQRQGVMVDALQRFTRDYVVNQYIELLGIGERTQ